MNSNKKPQKKESSFSSQEKKQLQRKFSKEAEEMAKEFSRVPNITVTSSTTTLKKLQKKESSSSTQPSKLSRPEPPTKQKANQNKTSSKTKHIPSSKEYMQKTFNEMFNP